MCQNKDAETIRHLSALSEIDAHPDTTETAIRRAKSAIRAQSSRTNIQARWSSILRNRFAILGSSATLAAAVVIGAILLYSPKPATAAQLLAAVEKATMEYSDWITTTLIESHPATNKPNAEHLQKGITHFQRSTGLRVSAYTINGKFRGAEINHTKKSNLLYDEGMTFIQEHPTSKGNWPLKDPVFPASLYEAWQREHPGTLSEITHTKDKGLDRFDYQIRKTATDIHVPEENITIWSDPQTKLITRFKAENLDGTVIAYEYTYTIDGPEPQSIYDVGVPRDIPISTSEARAHAQGEVKKIAEEVIAQLDYRVGVPTIAIAQSAFLEDGTPNPHFLFRIETAGDAVTQTSFYVGRSKELDKAGLRHQLINDWPKLDLDTICELTDGAAFCSRKETPDGIFTKNDDPDPNKRKYVYWQHFESKLAELTWGPLRKLRWPQLKSMELIDTPHPEHPEWVGLHITLEIPLSDGTKRTNDETCWFDPTHGYLAMKVEIQKTWEREPQKMDKFIRKIEKIHQLPNGQWIPIKLTQTCEKTDDENGQIRVDTSRTQWDVITH